MKRWIIGLLAVVVFAGATWSQAAVVTSYDIDRARLSSYGGWSHTYDGTIASNGDGTHSYSGGSGTINDGVIGTSHANTHLFVTADAPTVTLHLDAANFISEIRLYSFSEADNNIPGNITSVDVTIGGTTETINSIGFGPAAYAHENAHELIITLGTSLDSLGTDIVALSGFQTENPYSSHFSISEATVSGNVVPEPSTLAIWGLLGICGIVWHRRRKA
jgi:type 1 fimbria pilin